MKHVCKILRVTFFSFIALCLLIVMANECELIVPASCIPGTTASYYLLMAMEMATLVLIPLALWMFRSGMVRSRLKRHKEKALLTFGLLRISLVAIPMVLDTVLYYVSMTPSYAYLAIIHFLGLFFILPTMERCVGEVAAVQHTDTSTKE